MKFASAWDPQSTLAQQRLLGNAPIDVDEALLATIFRGALSYA